MTWQVKFYNILLYMFILCVLYHFILGDKESNFYERKILFEYIMKWEPDGSICTFYEFWFFYFSLLFKPCFFSETAFPPIKWIVVDIWASKNSSIWKSLQKWEPNSSICLRFYLQTHGHVKLSFFQDFFLSLLISHNGEWWRIFRCIWIKWS